MPSRLILSGLGHSDGKNPNRGPCKCGKALIWMQPAKHGGTVLLCSCTRGSVAVAVMAEEKKAKYNCMMRNFSFMSIAIETLVDIAPGSLVFLKKLGRITTGYQGREGSPISAQTILRGSNALVLLGAVGGSSSKGSPTFVTHKYP